MKRLRVQLAGLCYGVQGSAGLSRPFSSSKFLSKPLRSPRVRDKLRYPLPSRLVPQPNESGAIWPEKLIWNAFIWGGLSIEPPRAVALLDNFLSNWMHRNITPKYLEEMIDYYLVEPTDLTALAKIILTHNDARLNRVAKELLVAASDLNDQAATMILIDEALKYSRKEDLLLPEIMNARKKLRRYVDAGDPTATVMEANILQIHGNSNQALKLYERAIDTSKDISVGQDALNKVLSDASEALAMLYERSGNPEKAKKALEISAFKYDTPSSYLRLALKYHEPDSKLYHEYLLKAASSGVGEAARLLGTWYLTKIDKTLASSAQKVTSTSATSKEHDRKERGVVSHCYKLAKEWFLVTTELTTGKDANLAMLFLSRILRKQGDFDGCLQWLEKASKGRLSNVKDVSWLHRLWHGTEGTDRLTWKEFEARISGGD